MKRKKLSEEDKELREKWNKRNEEEYKKWKRDFAKLRNVKQGS
jgi:hypothetical protein